MVLGVCRRTLRNDHDAEDAFQATFVLLARHAASIRKAESLGSWLHGVAYRMARNAQRAAARRRRHEAEPHSVPEAPPSADMTWRELRSLLDEEVGRLAEPHRAAFVACCLEGKSGPQAARELGVKESTVWKRLAKARTILRDRLTARGVDLAALLGAVALGTAGPAAQLPPALASSAARIVAMSGMKHGPTQVMPATVAALLNGAKMSMFLSKLKTTSLAALALVACAGLGLSTVLRAGAAGDPPPVPDRSLVAPGATRSPDARSEDGHAADPVELSGRVLDPEGKPFAGATVFLGAHGPTGYAAEERATSGADGRFRVTLTKGQLDRSEAAEHWDKVRLLAVAEGYGPGWLTVTLPTPSAGVTLHLVKDLPIEGRILDVDGKPVVGAKVRAASVSAVDGNKVDDFLQSVRDGRYAGDGGRGVSDHGDAWIWPLPGAAREATTREDGRFRLEGIGRGRQTRLHLEGPGIQHGYLEAVTWDTKPVVGPELTFIGAVRIYGAKFDYAAAPARAVRGVVRDKATGKPLPGVTVRASGTTFAALTNKDGRYEVLGCAKATKYTVEARPGDARPEGPVYLSQVVEVEGTPGLGALTADVDLDRGIRATGRVTDAGTKKPVPGARVYYWPLPPNPHATGLRYDPNKGATAATATADGSFCLAVLPGHGLLGVNCPPGHPYMPALIAAKEIEEVTRVKIHNDDHINVQIGTNGFGAVRQDRYQTLRLINPDEKAEGLAKDLEVDRGRTFTGTVVGPDGRPLKGATLNGRTLPDATFRLTRQNPRRTRELMFVHREKGLGAYVEPQSEGDKPLTVELKPLGVATGRILDKDGQPRADFVVRVGHLEIKTDKDGRFQANGLVPGMMYGVEGADRLRHPGFFKSFAVEPGRTKDLGDARIDE